MEYCPDALSQFYYRERCIEDGMKSLPKCEICGEPIQQEMAVYIDGVYYCDECLHDHRVCID